MAPWYKSSKDGVRHSSNGMTLSLLFALLIQQAPAAADEDVCTLFHTETEMVLQTLYMHQEDVSHELVFPLVYFEDAWDRISGQIHEAQLFRVMIDDFSPVYRPDTAELLKTPPAPFMTFVIHDLVELDRIAEVSLRRAVPGDARALSDFERVDTDFGLHSLEPLGGQIMYRDVFVNFDVKDAVQAVISCRQPGDVLRPGCTHDFRTADIDVKIKYARVYLPEWSSIQGKISRFLSCALTSSDLRRDQ